MEKPSRNEDEYFARTDAEILETRRETAQREAVAAERRSHRMRCPDCGAGLIAEDHGVVRVERCSECPGVWFTLGPRQIGEDERGMLIDTILKSLARGMKKSGAPARQPREPLAALARPLRRWLGVGARR